MYGNHDKRFPFATREFPYIMSKVCKHFSYKDCNFQMKEKKAGCSRMALYKELGNHNIFTHETSFSGPSVEFDPLNKLIHFD